MTKTYSNVHYISMTCKREPHAVGAHHCGLYLVKIIKGLWDFKEALPLSLLAWHVSAFYQQRAGNIKEVLT